MTKLLNYRIIRYAMGALLVVLFTISIGSTFADGELMSASADGAAAYPVTVSYATSSWTTGLGDYAGDQAVIVHADWRDYGNTAVFTGLPNTATKVYGLTAQPDKWRTWTKEQWDEQLVYIPTGGQVTVTIQGGSFWLLIVHSHELADTDGPGTSCVAPSGCVWGINAPNGIYGTPPTALVPPSPLNTTDYAGSCPTMASHKFDWGKDTDTGATIATAYAKLPHQYHGDYFEYGRLTTAPSGTTTIGMIVGGVEELWVVPELGAPVEEWSGPYTVNTTINCAAGQVIDFEVTTQSYLLYIKPDTTDTAPAVMSLLPLN